MFQYPLFRIELLSPGDGLALSAGIVFQYPLFRIELLSANVLRLFAGLFGVFQYPLFRIELLSCDYGAT